VHAADADDTGETDAAARLAQLTGEPLPDDDVEFGEEDATANTAGEPEPQDDDPGSGADVELAPVDEIPAGDDDAEIEPVPVPPELPAPTASTESTASREDETAGDIDGEAGPVADDAADVPGGAADPVVTDQAVVDADDMDAPRAADGSTDR
jgi:hypothetical protein